MNPPQRREAERPAAIDPSIENISLIGFMACGKSAVGRTLARSIGWGVADLDQMLEEEAGMPVAEFFSLRGEPAFRAAEARALASALSRSRTVVATGGGAVLAEENRRLLRERSRVVWLRLSCAGVLSRLSRRGRERRPLLRDAERGDLEARVARLLAEREPLYRQTAHWTLIVDGRRPQQIAAEIARSIAARRTQPPDSRDPRARAPGRGGSDR